MLKVYDQNKNLTGYITKIKDLCIESDLSSGDKTLSFEYCAKKGKEVKNEYYIETKTDRYVVKDVDLSSDGYPSYQCQLDLEDLESCMHEKFSATNSTLTDVARLALAGTGWTVETDIDKKRSVSAMKATPFTILGRIRDAWMCEMKFDTKKKVVHFREKFGEDKGVYMISGLNLKRLRYTGDTYDFYTRIIPIGKDGLKITDINNNQEYVENYQYSDKIKTLIWEDTSYEDAKEMKKDAEAKLDDLSKPKKTYSVEVIDLAKQSVQYKILEYGLGDTVLLADETTGIREKQRIVKMKEYPQNPEKNSCELSNTTLTFEELQAKLEAAAAAFDNLTNADGTVKGVLVRGVEANGVVGIEVVINNSPTFIKLCTKVDDLNQDVTNVKGDISQVSSDLEYTKARLGTVETTYIKATEGAIGSAYIKDGAITNVKIAEATIEASKIKNINADVINVGTLRTDRLIITGPDGQDSIVKAINIANGISEAEVNGTKIQAASIDVVDLSAFHAKLAQFEVSMNAIYSGKTSIRDPTSGIYLATTGIGAGNGALAGINESPVQIYSEGSIKLKGKNALLDFNTVLGELNIEATSIKIASKAVATTGDVELVKKDLDAYKTSNIEFQQNIDGWKFKWEKIFNAENAQEDTYQSYITFENGNIILGENDVEMAKLSGDLIQLGKNSESSVIDLCNGTGRIVNANPNSGYKRLLIEADNSVEIVAPTTTFIKSENGKNSCAVEVGIDDKPWNPNGSSGAWTKIHAQQLVHDDVYNKGYIDITSKTIDIETHTEAALYSGISIVGDTGVIDIHAIGGIRLKSDNLRASASHFWLDQGYSIRSSIAGVLDCQLLGANSGNNIVLGWGAYNAKAASNTEICAGKNMLFRLGQSGKSWIPYYKPGDTVLMGNYKCSGYVTNSGKEVCFSIPIDRPMIGVTSVSVASSNGLIIRQGGKYTHGSSASTWVKPSSYSVATSLNCINVVATLPNTTNVVNNDTCGVQASIIITFT